MLEGYTELTGDQREHHFTVMFRVLRPKPQIGSGKKLPDSADDDAKQIAQLVCRHLDLCRIKIYLPPPAGQRWGDL